jgi:hypothetical protein
VAGLRNISADKGLANVKASPNAIETNLMLASAE